MESAGVTRPLPHDVSGNDASSVLSQCEFRSPAGNEDCLKLNVWVRNPLPSTPAPVIVWLHTGGFVAASANFASHDGRHFTEETGVIIVAPNYRLGPLGFLVHSALAAEDPNHAVSGNYGLLDQRKALEWVRDNIAAFGGDPNNVTIAGTSAGADSVGLHLVSPGSQGLFHRAIIESGTPTLQWPTHAESIAQGDAFATALGCVDPITLLACLRGKTFAQVLTACRSHRKRCWSLRPAGCSGCLSSTVWSFRISHDPCSKARSITRSRQSSASIATRRRVHS